MSVKETVINDRYVDVQGGQLFVRQWMPDIIKSDVPIILFHDSLGSVAQWRSFPLHLAEHTQRKVIAYDRLGFGRSSARVVIPSRAFIVEEADIYFPSICQALGIKYFCLLGHSVGGAMALTIASLKREPCKAVVTLAAPVVIQEQLLEGVRAAQRYFAHTESFNKLRKWHGEKARWVLDAWTDTWLSSDFRSWSIDPYLPNIIAPVLAIHGDKDEYGSVDLSVRIASGVKGPAKQATLENCGHIPHAEHPSKVIDLIEAFLDTLD